VQAHRQTGADTPQPADEIQVDQQGQVQRPQYTTSGYPDAPTHKTEWIGGVGTPVGHAHATQQAQQAAQNAGLQPMSIEQWQKLNPQEQADYQRRWSEAQAQQLAPESTVRTEQRDTTPVTEYSTQAHAQKPGEQTEQAKQVQQENKSKQ
jgi:hypothetical protein